MKISFQLIFTLTVAWVSYAEGEPTYPDTVTVSSTGAAADKQPECMGVYKRTPQTWSGRPVWKHTIRDDRFLFYHGAWFRWVIDNNVDNGPVYIQSKISDQINIPPTEWQYNKGGTFHDDNTLTVKDVAGNLLETERNILENYSKLNSKLKLRKTHPFLAFLFLDKDATSQKQFEASQKQFEDDYYPAYSRAKFYLRETRHDLRKLADRTVDDVRDLKIVLGHLNETNDFSFKLFVKRMKDLKIESLEEAREKYESAVKTFENTNSFILTKLFHNTTFLESGQKFETTINVLNSILNDEIDLISIWTQRAKVVSRNIDDSPLDILSKFESVRTTFVNGLDDLESVLDQFLAQPEVEVHQFG